MKGKNNAGFSLVEVLLAIAILAGIVIPVCTSLILSLRINAKAENILQARIAVSSAVETLMAEGISEDSVNYVRAEFPELVIETTEANPEEPETVASEEPGETEAGPLYYEVTVKDENNLVTVSTCIRAAEPQPTEGEGNP